MAGRDWQAGGCAAGHSLLDRVAYPDEILANPSARASESIPSATMRGTQASTGFRSRIPYEALRTLIREPSAAHPGLHSKLRHQRQSNPTIRAVLFKPAITNFADRAITRKILVPATGKKLAYSCWMQPSRRAGVLHSRTRAYRLDRSTLAYCGYAVRHGFLVGLFESVPEGVHGIGFLHAVAWLRPGGLRRRGECR